MLSRCLQCGVRPIRVKVEMAATSRRKVRVWRIAVCRDCWRVFETMLDEAAMNVQQGLGDRPERSPWWFI